MCEWSLVLLYAYTECLCTHSTTGRECYVRTSSETCLCINMGSQMYCFWLGGVRLKWEMHCKASTMNAATTPPPTPTSPVSIIFLNVLWLLVVGDHLFCAKHAFAEMGDMHITFGHEYGIKVWYISQSPNPKQKSVCQHCYTHMHARAHMYTCARNI